MGNANSRKRKRTNSCIDLSVGNEESSASSVTEDLNESDLLAVCKNAPLSRLTKNNNEMCENLQNIIDVDHGLLDELRSSKILTSAQTERIKYRKLYSRKVNQLINDVMNLSVQQQEQFLRTLEKTNQKHVVNYIGSNGVRSDEYGDDWPASFTEMWDAFERNRKTLVEVIDTRLGLLEKLISVGCISKRQKETVEVGQTNAIKNESIITIMGRKSVADYEQFIQCLVETKQHRVASLIAPGIVDNILPINQSQCLRLRVNHEVLIELIDSTNGFTTEI